jgi:hypothetical protein
MQFGKSTDAKKQLPDSFTQTCVAKWTGTVRLKGRVCARQSTDLNIDSEWTRFGLD